MRKLLISFAVVLMVSFAVNLHAQEFDAGLGFGTTKAPAAGNGFPSQSGGLYISFNGNLRLWMHHHLGVGGEVATRASQAQYGISHAAVSSEGVHQDLMAC